MNDDHLKTLAQERTFLDDSNAVVYLQVNRINQDPEFIDNDTLSEGN